MAITRSILRTGTPTIVMECAFTGLSQEALEELHKTDEVFVNHSKNSTLEEVVGSKPSTDRVAAAQRLWESYAPPSSPLSPKRVTLVPSYHELADERLIRLTLIEAPSKELVDTLKARFDRDPQCASRFLTAYLPPVPSPDHSLVDSAVKSISNPTNTLALNHCHKAIISAKTGGRFDEMLHILAHVFPLTTNLAVKNYVIGFHPTAWTRLYETIYIVDGAKSSDPKFGENTFLENPKGPLVQAALEKLAEDYRLM